MVCAAVLLYSCGSHKSTIKDKGKKPTETTTATKVSPKDAKDIEYDGKQWTRNVSSLSKPVRGLQNRHISVWASHGRYFNIAKSEWEWQRPYLFCTNEDLFTQTIVVPYLIPMLEKAGATVFTPRERDWQPNEIIVDNDDTPKLPYYTEVETGQAWEDGGCEGFSNASSHAVYSTTNPFTWGTTRKAKSSKTATCSITYQPSIPEDGKYAVYVSYPTIKKSVDNAEYTVYHKGGKTVFNVNQQMGGGTWVYLGTFEFSKGCSSRGKVVLTNASDEKGYVTADAVRFGGGMGNINRDGQVSGLPRCLEGARYYAQWAGAPDSVYNSKNGADDYKDDINVRSRMTNWLAGGSCYVPTLEGKHVPIELSVAVHSDAGYNTNMKSVYGSLSICTTDFHDGKLNSGISRQVSKDFAQMLLNGLDRDLKSKFGTWAVRELYDRNYSETRVPEMPSAIIETLSHQNFPDMVMGQDPNVKFCIARSIYKTALKFISKQHNKAYTVSPLAPINVFSKFVEEGVAELGWDEQKDMLESTAAPSGYIVYTATGNNDFDNGELVKGNRIRIRMSPDVLYRFRITAVNKGGESFPSETVAAVYHPGATKSILIVNGFDRLSAPTVIDNDTQQGFDMTDDPGVFYGMTVGWSGTQLNFDKSKAGIVGPNGLGYSGNEMEGMFIMGNTFDYAAEHAKAIMSAAKYNVVSTSVSALIKGNVDLKNYCCIDYILGLEKSTDHAMQRYKTFSSGMQTILRNYTQNGGNLLVSGAYIGSDMQSDNEKSFMRNVFHLESTASTVSDSIQGMGTSFEVYSELNAKHYAATRMDVLSALKPAFCSLTYSNGQSACVAYQGESYRTIAMGFPFECIKSDKKKATIMRGLLKFLDNK